MPDLVVIVPSRGRPEAVAALGEAFEQTCTAGTTCMVVVDADDPTLGDYHAAPLTERMRLLIGPPAGTMVSALNLAATELARVEVFAVGFMGDDHRPRSLGWDTAYLDALHDLGTGIVYGDDLLQGAALPTQVAMTADIIRTLGWMAPPTLVHLYVDNFWRDLGHLAGCLRFLPGVVVEHVHPVAGKAPMDPGYERVNAPQMYARDMAAYTTYATEHLFGDVAKVRGIRG